jgi:hypothetical protein
VSKRLAAFVDLETVARVREDWIGEARLRLE